MKKTERFGKGIMFVLVLSILSMNMVMASDISESWDCDNGLYCEQRDCGLGKIMYNAGDGSGEHTYLWFTVE